MPNTEIFPSVKKRLLLLFFTIVLTCIVVKLTPFPSASFILYVGLCFAALGYILIRLFDRNPVLVLSEAGVLSHMTIGAEKIGLILWADIHEIRDARLFWLLKRIELHAIDSVAVNYQARLNENERSQIKTLLISLTNEEVRMKHEDLLLLLNQYWNASKINTGG